ncbi:DUF3164 family protein [Psychroflexus sp. ALD_RP9]|uniref:DUF3164 family protein n=1 Tax=Psychroflexus sp. ALD_RP9 TaxID=2777186 RepID=UPI001A8EB231|nr:DUF3164 family protein [Psychroflexus sp. ALD_RP9]QSS96613.1 DUF3164 family protein [Psychroflexus sp. ALD_RP9]
MNTENPTLDLSTLSEKDLQEEIKRRKEAKKQAEIKAKKEYEADKENYLAHSASKFKQLHNELQALKAYSITEANKLYQRMYEINGKEPKTVNSFTLKNEADNIKVTVDRQERFEFTDEAMVHINAIRDIFKSKFAERNKGLYNILDGLLIKNSKMEYDPKLLAKARRQVRELGDDNLISEFDKLDECQKVTGSSMYCRLHVRDDQGKWQDVSLQFSSL